MLTPFTRGFWTSATTWRTKINCEPYSFLTWTPRRCQRMLGSVCLRVIFFKCTMMQVCSRSSTDPNLVFFSLDDWDCVATCFFIDTAHNVIEYVERMWKILKPGGVWINFGSLLSLVACRGRNEVLLSSSRSLTLSFWRYSQWSLVRDQLRRSTKCHCQLWLSHWGTELGGRSRRRPGLLISF